MSLIRPSRFGDLGLNACKGQVVRTLVSAALVSATLMSVARADILEERWSFSVGLGTQLPALSALSDGLFNSPMVGTADILLSEGAAFATGDEGAGGAGADEQIDTNEVQVQPFRIDNDLPPVQPGINAGMEFQWHANDRHSVIIGMGSWEQVSQAVNDGEMPMQEYLIDTTLDRRAKISFTEFSLGWRYNFLRRPNFRFYTRLSLHEVFDIDYREDWVFNFTESPVIAAEEDPPRILALDGVRRVMVVEAQTAAVFMGQLGFGAEWFFQDWMSVSTEMGYFFGERQFTLGNTVERDDFQSSDSIIRLGMPYSQINGDLSYLNSAALTPLPSTLTFEEAVDIVRNDVTQDAYETLKLGFDGWRAMLRFNVYY